MSIRLQDIQLTEGSETHNVRQLLRRGFLEHFGMPMPDPQEANVVAAVTEQARAEAYAEQTPDWKARIVFTQQLESMGLYPWPPSVPFPPP